MDYCHFEHLRTDRFTAVWASMSVMEDLVTIHGVDALYWFSDLKDDQDFASLRRLRELLRRGGVRLYVKSLSENPSREFEKIIHDFQS